MKIEIGKILEGLGNSIFVKESVEQIAAERLAICKLCKYYSPNVIASGGGPFARKDAFCVDCGCNLHLKTRSLASFCPLGTTGSHFPNEMSKWPAVTIDPQVADKIAETPDLKKELDDYKIRLAQNKIEE